MMIAATIDERIARRDRPQAAEQRCADRRGAAAVAQ